MRVLCAFKTSAYERYFSDTHIAEYMHSYNSNVKRLYEGHLRQKKTIDFVKSVLDKRGVAYDFIERENAHCADIRLYDLVISLGGDGTFLSLSHCVEDKPILGVNTDITESTGFYCVADVNNFDECLDRLDEQTALHRFNLKLQGHLIDIEVLNDILIAHRVPAAMTRLRFEGVEYRCSGMLISTASGSTGWISSAGGSVMDLEDERVQYLLRDIPQGKCGMVSGLSVESLTRQGEIYVDGDFKRFEFTLGDTLEIVRGKDLHVVGDIKAKREKILQGDNGRVRYVR